MSDFPTYRFGDVSLDIARMALSRGGQAVAVEPKVIDVLRFLIEHRDRLVTKDELLDEVWHEAFVTPNALTRAVAQLRKAIGDNAQEALYIETVTKRGYRFIAPVTVEPGEQVASASPPASAFAPPTPEPPRRTARFSRRAVITATGGLIALVGLLAWTVVPTRPALPEPASTLRLTTRVGAHTWPAVSPDGSLVAYASDQSGGFEIYVVGAARGSQVIALTSDGQQNTEPAWSPDGRWIAFHSMTRGGIWVMPSTGGAAIQVADSGSQPSWSPDGDWIAFSSSQGAMLGQAVLRVVNRDGTAAHDVTRLGEPQGSHVNPEWSADGGFLAFASMDNTTTITLWRAPVSGGVPTPVPTPVTVRSPYFAVRGDALVFFGGEWGASRLFRLRLEPVTSTAADAAATEIAPLPDGNLEGISVAINGTAVYAVASSDANLWAVDIGDGDAAAVAVRVTNDSVRNTLPTYSPDGQRIAFVQFGAGVEANVRIMRADGTGADRPLPEGVFGYPSWSPDGTRLLIESLNADPKLTWIDLARRRATAVRPGPPSQARMIRISPDGTHLAFWMPEPNGAMNAWVQGIDTAVPVRLTDDAEAVNYPVWAPDGQTLAVEIKRGEVTHIGIVSKTGGTVTQLTKEAGQSWPHSWSPDGEHIAFAGQRAGVWNVWTVSRLTGTSRQLTSFTSANGYVRYPSWSPLGDRIVFERGTSQSSVWITQLR